MSLLPSLTAIVRHAEPASTQFVLERSTALGTLRLELDDFSFVLSHPQGLSAAEEAEAHAAFLAARQLYHPSNPGVSEAAMRDIVRRWPLWGGGHGALHDLYKVQGRFEEAAYHMRQLIALQPTYENLLSLGELLGRLGRLDDARTLQEHLWSQRDHATPGIVEPDPRALAFRAATHLLVTLTRQQRGEQMVRVADEALAAFGEHSTLRYQRVMGLILDGRREQAQAECAAALRTLDARDPMAPRFRQMAGMLGL